MMCKQTKKKDESINTAVPPVTSLLSGRIRLRQIGPLPKICAEESHCDRQMDDKAGPGSGLSASRASAWT